jgi:hypothetical protein
MPKTINSVSAAMLIAITATAAPVAAQEMEKFTGPQKLFSHFVNGFCWRSIESSAHAASLGRNQPSVLLLFLTKQPPDAFVRNGPAPSEEDFAKWRRIFVQRPAAPDAQAERLRECKSIVSRFWQTVPVISPYCGSTGCPIDAKNSSIKAEQRRYFEQNP